jgi:hypothetical protein
MKSRVAELRLLKDLSKENTTIVKVRISNINRVPMFPEKAFSQSLT